MTRIIPALIATALALGACATNPVSKQSQFVLMSEKQELALGAAAAEQVAKNMPLLPSDDPLVRYVDHVGQRVAKVSDRPDLFYRFHVVDDAEINAFALPGGYIYVDRGLLVHMNSEAELAAVLGHEIGHVAARHAVQQYTKAQAYNLGMAVTSIFVPIPYGADQLGNLLATAIITGYGREDELQADELSIKYITAAGFDPDATPRSRRTPPARPRRNTTAPSPPIRPPRNASWRPWPSPRRTSMARARSIAWPCSRPSTATLTGTAPTRAPWSDSAFCIRNWASSCGSRMAG
jgi:predicted Zn-dependent protease